MFVMLGSIVRAFAARSNAIAESQGRSSDRFASGDISGIRRNLVDQNAPSRIRTCGLLLRRESLYPAELSGQFAPSRSELAPGVLEQG
jgi:hypothetical protein